MVGSGQVTRSMQHRTGEQTRPVVHRVTTSTAAVVDDPSRAELTGLLGEVARSGRGSFLIAQRRAGQPGETYLQAVRQPTSWVLEVFEDGRVVRAEVDDTDLVGDVLVSWTRELPAWQRLAWHPVVRDQQWLTHA